MIRVHPIKPAPSMDFLEREVVLMKTRKEFLEAVMKMAKLRDLEQADEAAQAVISLTKAIIGEGLSKKIAEVSPPDLRKGWESIEPSPVDFTDRVGIY